MAHYVCTGECGGISDHAKVCEGENCTKKNQLMAECTCGDENHVEITKDATEKEG